MKQRRNTGAEMLLGGLCSERKRKQWCWKRCWVDCAVKEGRQTGIEVLLGGLCCEREKTKLVLKCCWVDCAVKGVGCAVKEKKHWH